MKLPPNIAAMKQAGFISEQSEMWIETEVLFDHCEFISFISEQSEMWIETWSYAWRDSIYSGFISEQSEMWIETGFFPRGEHRLQVSSPSNRRCGLKPDILF